MATVQLTLYAQKSEIVFFFFFKKLMLLFSKDVLNLFKSDIYKVHHNNIKKVSTIILSSTTVFKIDKRIINVS